MRNSTRILNWDSDFFNKKIASINISQYDEKYILEKLNFYENRDFDLIYLFVDDNSLSSIITGSFDCKLVDTRVVYSIDISDNTEFEECVHVKNFAGNSSELYDLGVQAGQESRYNLDNDFTTNDFQRLYKVWIDNSCNGQLAGNVSVYRDNGRNLGFITLKKKENVMSIILIATDQKYREIGIGKNLVLFAKKYAKENNCVRLDVVTQKHNNVACHFYSKCGMVMNPLQTNIYHIWLKKPINNI